MINFLYSDILPLKLEAEQQTILESFKKCLQEADRVDIAVGYTSNASLEELNEMVNTHAIKQVNLLIGMYYWEGMPEKSYHTAIRINNQWMAKNIGSIRLISTFKYHGKVYLFFKNNMPFAAIIGSANLSVLKPDASTRRQYELSILIDEKKKLDELMIHVKALSNPQCSVNINDVKNLKLLRERNTSLDGVELVSVVPPNNVEYYQKQEGILEFPLKLKVPHYEERHMDDGKHYTKSNINVCYAAPRSKRKARDWFEMQLTVGADIYKQPGYPTKNSPFFIVTDDGYQFKAHTTSDNNKQFSAVGDELIMGRWLKGRLAAAGIVTPVNDTSADVERQGMITAEMLEEYGCDQLIFKKTGHTALDEDGNALDVWYLSFNQSEI